MSPAPFGVAWSLTTASPAAPLKERGVDIAGKLLR